MVCATFCLVLTLSIKMIVLFVQVDVLPSSQQFFSHVGTNFLGRNQYKVVGIECLAQVHNTVPRVRLKSTTCRSGVEHSTTVLPDCFSSLLQTRFV